MLGKHGQKIVLHLFEISVFLHFVDSSLYGFSALILADAVRNWTASWWRYSWNV